MTIILNHVIIILIKKIKQIKVDLKMIITRIGDSLNNKLK
jgi:hypothetical protein